MHPNPAFRQTPRDTNLGFARTRGFGTLCVNGDSGPMLAHVPFLVSEDGTEVHLHLVRSNPIARALSQDLQAVVSVSGPDGYISPDWYGADDQVPTWNYVAVHLRGVLSPMPDTALRDVLDRLSADFEARLAPKPPWLSDKMSADALARMMRMIQPVRLQIGAVDGTWKLGQNKPDAARIGAAAAVLGGVGHELTELAALMQAADGS
ncbi:FMN-binding negative transcriptional regulator [Aliiroseovarius subalbicans]|uniref:FMN-binding negative transcriptional regulator n=1 Tax=Aliiroseovarius subalbicans TaxID=2925840 RepID=UPI001F56D094|nr:FMN-binding negative transcriptional regulator [Aliiroseovarius subalbicans]MCI2399991.1 FMN-binding negative transcriptional regulator [Aliiroseovarius subalbicans]